MPVLNSPGRFDNGRFFEVTLVPGSSTLRPQAHFSIRAQLVHRSPVNDTGDH